MKRTTCTKNILLSILAITLSLTMVGCNKDDKTTAKDETTIVAPIEKVSNAPAPIVAPAPKTPTTKVTQTSTSESNITVNKTVAKSSSSLENDQLDLAALGFEVKDDLLYYNDVLLSANKIVNFTIESDKALFNNSDSSTIMINANGDIEAVFPVGLKLNVASKLAAFELSYGVATFTLPTIVNLTGNNDWYRLTLADNIYLRFNDTIIEAYVDDLIVSINPATDNTSTKFQDSVLSTSSLKSYYVNDPSIQLSYEDGSILTHTIGGDTTFTQINGMDLINAEEPTITMNEKTTTLDDNVVAFAQEEEVVEAVIETENVELIINSKSLAIEDENINPIVNPEKEAEIDLAFQNLELASDGDIIFDDMGAFEAPLDTPNHVGIVGNYSYLNGTFNTPGQQSLLGGRLDIIIEKEISTNLSIALELGIGTNKFDDETYLTTITPMFTVDYNFKLLNSDSFIPYATLGVGTMIPLDNSEHSYFRAKLGGGVKYNINNTWMLKAGANYTFNKTADDILHGIEVPVGIMYKF